MKRLGLFFAVFVFNFVIGKNAITYQKWSGRLGDQLLMYIKAKYLAEQQGLTMVYKPYSFLDKLNIYKWETCFSEAEKKKYTRVVRLQDGEVPHTTQDNVLYEIGFYYRHPEWENPIQINTWHNILADESFRQKLRTLIKPFGEVSKPSFPQNTIRVAVHVRKGGGYDPPLLSKQVYTKDELKKEKNVTIKNSGRFSDITHTLKFPPNQFYIDCIQKLIDMFDGAQFYIHIFTDGNPEELTNIFKNEIQSEAIEWGCAESTDYLPHTLGDLFAMAECDCLIRANSNLSNIAQLIGCHGIVFSPVSYRWYEGNILYINDIDMRYNSLNNSPNPYFEKWYMQYKQELCQR